MKKTKPTVTVYKEIETPIISEVPKTPEVPKVTATVSKDTSITNGTCLRGHVSATYDALVDALGEPITGRSGDGKTTCEWILKFDCGSIATIYDWKMGITPMREYEWHIGGTGIDVVRKVGDFLNLPVERVQF
jgi:hypothetical protein